MPAAPSTSASTASTAPTTAGGRPTAASRRSTACPAWSTPLATPRSSSTPACAAAPTRSRRSPSARAPSAIGRPYAYALAVGGTAGVEHLLRCLLAEMDLTMAVDGYPTHRPPHARRRAPRGLSDRPAAYSRSSDVRGCRRGVRPVHGPLLVPARGTDARAGRGPARPVGARRRLRPGSPHGRAGRPAGSHRRVCRRSLGVLRRRQPPAAPAGRRPPGRRRGSAVRRRALRRRPRPARRALHGRSDRRAEGDASRGAARRCGRRLCVGPRRRTLAGRRLLARRHRTRRRCPLGGRPQRCARGPPRRAAGRRRPRRRAGGGARRRGRVRFLRGVVAALHRRRRACGRLPGEPRPGRPGRCA